MVDMLLTGFDAKPVEQVLYLDRPLREHGLLQAIARVNRTFSHDKDGTPTEKTHGLVVDYCGISHDLEQALASFEWDDVQDTMQALEEDPATVIDAAADPGRITLPWSGPERHMGVRPRVRARRQHRGQLQGRPVRAIQRRLPPVLPPDGPAAPRPAWAALRRPVGPAHVDPLLRPCPLPSRKRRSKLDRHRRQSETAHRPAHQRRGPPDDAASLHPRPGLRRENRPICRTPRHGPP